VRAKLFLPILFVMASLMMVSLRGSADEPHIIEVRRHIPLSDQEPIYRDYYIKTEGQAFKTNMLVTALRKLGVKDATGNQNVGEITIPIGQLKVIHVENNLAVAREVKLLSREALPLTDQSAIMAGDLIDSRGK
jgi:hypothetical protein